MLWNSSPCQDISIVGQNAGAKQGSGTRSSLIYEVIRIAKEIQPKYIIWENVANLLSKKHKFVLDDYINNLTKLNYTSYYQILDAKDYGIPQSRKRLFVVSIRNDLKQLFEFPKPIKLTRSWRDFIDDEENLCCIKKTPSRDKMRKLCKNITNSQYCNCITTKQDRYPNAGIIDYKDYFRLLTPKEQWLLMGFDKEDYYKAKEVSNNKKSILEKQAGNSVVVDVIKEIFDVLLIEYK